jgi:hypothetical protein
MLMMVLTATAIFGQIKTTKVASKTDKVDITRYDSTQNYLRKDVYKYLGQDLYVIGKADGIFREYGYENFVTDYTIDSYRNKSVVYKSNDYFNSTYNELAGKYFKVIQVIKHPRANENEVLYGSKFFFKLVEKENKDTVYFEYESKYEHEYPFIIVGFFEKQKKVIVGEQFIFQDFVLKGSPNIKTGEDISIVTGQIWKCTDLTVEERYYNLSLLIENPLGEKTTISYNHVFDSLNKGRVFSKDGAENYIKRFGKENFNTILQAKLKIGMTAEMCKLSWGRPKSINETITSGNKTEQWVYKDNYLYFDNGILTAIQ